MLPKFGTRHHVAIAKEIKEHMEYYNIKIDLRVVKRLIAMFESDNPNFNRTRFIKACGLGIDAPEIIKVS